MNRSPALAARTVVRRLYRLEIALAAVLDLCVPSVWDALGLTDAPACFLDRTKAGAAAHYARYGLGVHAIRVPSIGFLDQLQHYCLVVFLEALPPSPDAWIAGVEESGLMQLPA